MLELGPTSDGDLMLVQVVFETLDLLGVPVVDKVGIGEEHTRPDDTRWTTGRFGLCELGGCPPVWLYPLFCFTTFFIVESIRGFCDPVSGVLGHTVLFFAFGNAALWFEACDMPFPIDWEN